MKINARFFTVSLIIVLASLSRLIPHVPNFTAISAMALFGAACYSKKYTAFFIPLAILILTDAIIGFYSGMLWVYGAFMLVVAIGFILRKKLTVTRVITASVISSILFFVLTNFGVWAGSMLYPHTLTGLTACYAAGLPFFRNEIFGTLFYSGVLFGVYYLARRNVPALANYKA